MNKSTPILKTICAATILAMGLSAQANASERYIVTYDSNSQGLKKGHQIKVEGKNWFAVELDEKGKSAMKAKAGFKNIEVDAKRYPMWADTPGNPNGAQVSPYGYFQSQANQLSLNPGQKVCIVDSGIAGSQGETGGKNFDFDWGVITGDNDSGTGNWDADGGAHGTHVAGTVGAIDNGFGVIGMAPGVPMHIIKVFNDAGWGYSSDLAQAADLCLAAGANIINMSLGGGGANSTEENAFINFTANAGANGGLVLAAAGNDGNSVRSYPAGYESVMMVGAVDANDTIASFSQFPSNTMTSGRGKNRTTVTNDGFGVEVTAGGVGTLSTVPSGTGGTSGLSAGGTAYASSGMENLGSASGTTFYMGTAEATDAGASGNICVIDRGVISFHDKVLNCEDSGGIGAVIINNEAGMLYGTLGSPNSTSIPAVGAALEDRTALMAATTATVTVESGDYAYFDGTSMATPTVSGVAALVWSNHPTCTGTEIRNALKATAQDQGAPGRDDYFGYGIVKAKDASDYLTANGCEGGVVEPPPPPPPSGDLAASGSRSKGGSVLNITWSGFNSTSTVDIGINTLSFPNIANDGAESFSGASKRTAYTISVCETGTTNCAPPFIL